MWGFASSKTLILSRYLRGLLGTYNERVEQMMDKLAAVADDDMEVSMLHSFNRVTLDVLAKVSQVLQIFLWVVLIKQMNVKNTTKQQF